MGSGAPNVPSGPESGAARPAPSLLEKPQRTDAQIKADAKAQEIGLLRKTAAEAAATIPPITGNEPGPGGAVAALDQRFDSMPQGELTDSRVQQFVDQRIAELQKSEPQGPLHNLPGTTGVPAVKEGVRDSATGGFSSDAFSNTPREDGTSGSAQDDSEAAEEASSEEEGLQQGADGVSADEDEVEEEVTGDEASKKKPKPEDEPVAAAESEEETAPSTTDTTPGDAAPTPPPPDPQAESVAAKAAREQHNKAVGDSVLKNGTREKVGDELMKEVFGGDLDNPQGVDNLQATIDKLTADPRPEAKRLAQRLREQDAIVGMSEAQKELEGLKRNPVNGDPNSDAHKQAVETANKKIDAGKKANRNIDAREQLTSDSEFAQFLQEQGIDPEGIDVEKELGRFDDERYKNPDTQRPDLSKMDKKEQKLYLRLAEAKGLSLRHEAQKVLDDPNADQSSDEYQKAKKQFTSNDWSARQQYIREAILHDKGLRKLVERAGYDIGGFNIDDAVAQEEHKDKNSVLARRLKELDGTAETAVLSDRLDYVTSSSESDELVKQMEEAESHRRGWFRRKVDGFNTAMAGISSEALNASWKQAKGYGIAVKQYRERLENENLHPDTRKALEASLENALKLRNKKYKEVFMGKAGRGLLIWLFLSLAAITVGPAILPSKLMEWGKGMK